MARNLAIAFIVTMAFLPTLVATADVMPRNPIDASRHEEPAVRGEWGGELPAPSPPFDETPITPVESAGAPMYP